MIISPLIIYSPLLSNHIIVLLMRWRRYSLNICLNIWFVSVFLNELCVRQRTDKESVETNVCTAAVTFGVNWINSSAITDILPTQCERMFAAGGRRK